MEVFNLNIIPGAVAPIIHASQYDDGREFRANLFEGASVYTLTGAETITINVRKPDGNVVTAAVTNTADSYVEFATTEQMTACSGANLCELKFENSPVKIGSLNFILSVEADPLEGGIQSESAIHDLQAQIAAAVAEQYDAADVIFDAAPTPGHGVGFTVTSEGIATAVQDAKDYTDTAIGGLSIPENITDLADVNITTPTDGEILVYNNGVWENQANPASTANFAPDYDDTQTYNTNDKVIYQGLLYICNDDNVTGTWDATKWDAYTVADITGDTLPISSGSATNTKDYIDTGLSGKADTTDIPMWVKQTSGQAISLQMPCVFFWYYADQWQAHIPLPLVAQNTSYSISLTEVIAENIGNITAKCSVQSKTNTFFDIQTTRTMTALPDTFSTCVGRCKFTITFS